MGYNSQPGQIGFGVQSVRGTPVAATRFMRLRSGSLGGDRQLLVPDPEIGGNRDIPAAYMGPVSFSGDLEFYPRMQSLALLLRGVLGSASSATSGSAVDEVQTLTVTGTPTGGNFKLRFRGQTTAVLDWDSTSAEIITALNALDIVTPGDIVGGGGPLPGSAVTLTAGAGGIYNDTNMPAISVVDEALTGGTAPAAAVSTTTPGTPAVGTHTITPADTTPWLTVEERLGTGLESFQYVDAKVNTLHLEAEATGYLMGTAQVVALSQSSGFSQQANPDWDESPMMVGQQILVSFGGNVLGAKSFSLDINNNIETDDFNLGSIFLADMVEKRREVTAGFSYRPQNADLWKAAMYGDSSATEPGAGPAFEGPLEIFISSVETIGDIAAGTPFSVRLYIPYAVLTPFKINPSGDDVIQNDIEITAIRPDAVEPIITATVVNDVPTVT